MNDVNILNDFTKDLFLTEYNIHLIDTGLNYNTLEVEEDYYAFLNSKGIYYQIIERNFDHIIIKVIGINSNILCDMLEEFPAAFKEDGININKVLILSGDVKNYHIDLSRRNRVYWFRGLGLFKGPKKDG